ncbi:type VI secretion system protein TssL, long form [Caballeronia sp. LZ043]|nr:type VI secretion system protein TssL, long form [Caballeronia sp. LZ043]MDR5823380.1 type VI secretion system protein TssL, long form [Caballeronia sp. LZ043]
MLASGEWKITQADITPDAEQALQQNATHAQPAQDKQAETAAEVAFKTAMSRMPPGEVPAARLRAILAAGNPLLEAARPLLRALADMPDNLTGVGMKVLQQLLEDEVRNFQRLCEQANIRRDHMLGASYCLSTALDEAAMQTEWDRNSPGAKWSTKTLAAKFHEDVKGGVKIFNLIGRLLEDSHEHLDLIEVIYRVLSLGFMGTYRTLADGARRHDGIRRLLFNKIQEGRNPLPLALSPHADSTAHGKRLSLWNFPAWISFTVLGLALLGLFGWFKYHLLSEGALLETRIIEIGRMTPPPAPRVPRLRELLENEIAANMVSVDEDARHSTVTFRGDAMFAPGGIDVNAAMTPLIVKIAGEVARVPGRVTVTGYTDNLPIRSRRYASNDALSLERATQVVQQLQAAGVPAGRLEAVGRGASSPLGDNRTASGRAVNRRVEIAVVP